MSTATEEKHVSGNVFGRIFDRVIDVFIWIAFGMVIFSWLAVCSEVLLRYFLHSPLPWVIEVTEYMLVQMTFLGTAWLLRRDGHVVVDVLLKAFSARKQAFLGIVSSGICVLVSVFLTWWGAVTWWEFLQNRVEVLWTEIHMPYYGVMAVIPLGCALLVGQFLRRTRAYLQEWKAARGGA
ncbi:MAG: TRAP transporter small permease [Chloroflexota bacterium]